MSESHHVFDITKKLKLGHQAALSKELQLFSMSMAYYIRLVNLDHVSEGQSEFLFVLTPSI